MIGRRISVSARCASCDYWEPGRRAPQSEMGECRRHPPCGPPIDGDHLSRSPVVRRDHWCGDYEREGYSNG